MRILRQRYCWKDYATSMVTLFKHGRQEELTDYPEEKMSLNVASKISSP